MKKILWIRELSCGHSRMTNLAFISGNYDKPKVGDVCYCRVCWGEAKVTKVRKAETIKPIEKLQKHIDKIRKSDEVRT